MKFISGPMATISHRAFRNLVEKFGGVDEYFNEMISAGSLVAKSQFEKFYIDPLPAPEKIVWQLVGSNLKSMSEATKILCELPGIGIDLNMGCCAPDIVRSGAGISWMLKDISETREMIQEVKQVIENYNLENKFPKRFSVKLRLGADNFSDEQFFKFTDMLVKEGVQLLTLHPRTQKEKLIRPPRYHYANDLKLRYKNDAQIYVNGNVKDVSSFKFMAEVCPDVDGVMISRACVQRPWIFYELKKNENSELQKIDMEEIALDYISDVEKFQPSEFWKTRLQRFFEYFSQNFKFSHYAKTQWQNAINNEDLRNRIKDFFIKCPEEKYKFI